MSEQKAPRRRAHGGGRDARVAARSANREPVSAYITRGVPVLDVLSAEGIELIEHNAEIILEEIGVDFRDDEAALALWRNAGADVQGERVHFAPGLCRSLIQASAPREFVQHARNPSRSVTIGGDALVLAPAYGPPFVRDLEGGRRYATIEDFRNFVRLAYASPGLHHSGGTLCEPVDLPVESRHLDMLLAHMTLSDKPFMGSVTAPERAEDSVAMARIVFGEHALDERCVLINLINANSPLVWDATMLGAARVYAAAINR